MKFKIIFLCFLCLFAAMSSLQVKNYKFFKIASGVMLNSVNLTPVAWQMALAMAAGVMGLLATIPGLPILPFLSIAMVLGFFAYRVFDRQRTAARIEAEKQARESSRDEEDGVEEFVKQQAADAKLLSVKLGKSPTSPNPFARGNKGPC